MGKKALGNLYNNGNQGKLMINGLPILTCYKAKIEKKKSYEEVDHPTLPGRKVRVETGETIEVSFTFKKTAENYLMDWESDDITLIIMNPNANGTMVESMEASGITFDTTQILEFEKGKVGEIEMSGQAEDMKKLV